MQIINKPFVFARHAQSAYNADSLIGGFTDSPLTNKGIEQAKEAAAILSHIEWSVVITSTLQRTQQTASYAVPNQAIIPYEKLKERNWGDLEGCPIEQQLPYEVTPPNGESWDAFEARIISALNDILRHYPQPLIIAHSGVYRVLNNVINGTPYCPRIGNVSPISFIPNQDDDGWKITPLKGKSI
ncbi:phosphoglycerate mutase [Marinomonas ushuaiensis DSM 15871]|uniref:Phosphoglycerate mutase n=1 Tax=Marinomonas ushuaiensis DSM 15871 TaxID=1122207 RepID=X7EAK2_9GAMM|nr:histidine phosphatase family protein [Marinomonas ushuaiensis]ETX12246.1 phosphoglycerate mutase [Marinomonas ushuaiensis DSM 15871]